MSDGENGSLFVHVGSQRSREAGRSRTVKALYRLLKQPFFGRYGAKPWRWPENVADGGWERVRFTSASGAELGGLLGRGAGPGPRAGVVLAHPMGAAAKGFFLKNGVADMLLRARLDVLLFDFNGFGESETGNFDYPADVIAAGEYLKARCETTEVGALGVSFGAAWIACAASRPEHPFSSAVLDSPFARLEEYWSRYPFANIVLRAISLAQPELAKSLRPVERITELHGLRSALLVYGSADEVTPVSVGERLFRAAQGSEPTPELEFWVVNQAEHMKAFQTDEAGYRERVLSVLAPS